jgi:hypothetical protein
MKSNSDNRPPVLRNLGDGSWHYNYDIKEVQITNENEGERNVFDYNTVHFFGEPTYEKIVSAIIRENYTLDNELSIQRQRDSNPEKFEAYDQFCENIKEMVKADLQAIVI